MKNKQKKMQHKTIDLRLIIILAISICSFRELRGQQSNENCYHAFYVLKDTSQEVRKCIEESKKLSRIFRYYYFKTISSHNYLLPRYHYNSTYDSELSDALFSDNNDSVLVERWRQQGEKVFSTMEIIWDSSYIYKAGFLKDTLKVQNIVIKTFSDVVTTDSSYEIKSKISSGYALNNKLYGKVCRNDNGKLIVMNCIYYYGDLRQLFNDTFYYKIYFSKDLNKNQFDSFIYIYKAILDLRGIKYTVVKDEEVYTFQLDDLNIIQTINRMNISRKIHYLIMGGGIFEVFFLSDYKAKY